jgi:hypothetical protein
MKADKGLLALSEIRSHGEKMVKGSDWTAEETRKSMAKLDNEIRKLGDRPKP